MSTERERELLKDALVKIRTLRAQLEAAERTRNEPVAIVGAGCRFPGGVASPDDYWRLLRDGVDAISDVPAGRWDVDAYYDADPDAPGKAYVRQAGFLNDVDGFDADFFGISPREAMRLDPQQRLLLEVSWEALENAATAPDRLSGSLTGVYVGLMNSEHAYRQAHDMEPVDIDPYALTGNDLSFPAGRLAYFLGLQGPAMVVTTACSSSLVAVHLACQALRNRECDQALAGGVSLMLDPVTNVMLSKIRALAKDGRSKAFDASADGYGRGEGCGVVVLKRLSDAMAAGDRILSVIRGSAVNHDGPSAGLTVPSGSAQERLLRQAVKAAGVHPADVAYVEAHGTGTSLGDPIEVQALAKVYGARRLKPLMIGSVKTNIGHLEGAAGIAGLIKTALALDRGEIPPQLHFRNPNPHVPWSDLSIQVATEVADWPAATAPKLAGVSSFGLSGVNAHVVLEAAPPSEAPQRTARSSHVLALSAKTAQALAQQVQRFAHSFEQHPEADWADVCATTNTGRAHFRHRTAIAATSVAEARGKLADAARLHSKAEPRLGFAFAGHGEIDRRVARELYQTHEAFRRAIDGFERPWRAYFHESLADVLLGNDALEEVPSSETTSSNVVAAESALYVLECALVDLWKSWGIAPSVVTGQGAGEFAAAYAAGVFSAEDGLKLVAERAKAREALSPQLARLGGSLAARHAVALTNGAASTLRSVASSESGHAYPAAVDRRQAVMTIDEANEDESAITSSLAGGGSNGFHDPFEQTLRQVSYSVPGVRFLSSLTGKSVQRELTTSGYWRRHFDNAGGATIEAGWISALDADVVVEIGPGDAASLRPRTARDPSVPANGNGAPVAVTWLSCFHRGRNGAQIAQSVAELYRRGVDVDWLTLEQGKGRRWRKLALPTYPFEHQRYWAFDHERKHVVDRSPAIAFEKPSSQPSLIEQAQNVPATQRADLFQNALSRQIESVLGLTRSVDATASLLELGLDSLMATELASWVGKNVGVSMELKELLSGKSIQELGALLCERTQSAAPTATASPSPEAPAHTADPNKHYPLSHGQRALWFIHQSAPESSAYNVGVPLQTPAKLDVALLRDALQALVDRHPSLRTTFRVIDGEPVQKSASRQEVCFESVDAASWTDEELKAHVTAAYRRPFDLTTGPVFRAHLYTRAEDEHVLLLAMHHIVCDAISFWTMLEELTQVYESSRAGRTESLPPQGTTYDDYVRWQRDTLASAEGEKLWRYWRQQLSGELPVLSLPTDHPRPRLQTYNGDSCRIAVSQALTSRLKKLARSEQATLYHVLLAAFNVLLQRYTGQQDLVVGSATAGRTSRFSRVVGYFVNPVPIRADLSGNPAFSAFLEQIRRTTLDALDHQQLPFPLLVERLQPKRDPSRSPIFQADFALQKSPTAYRRALVGVGGTDVLHFEPFEMPEEEGQFDVSLHIAEQECDLTAVFKYNADLFEAETIRRMAEAFVALLGSIVQDPRRPIAGLPLLSTENRRRLVDMGRGPAVEYAPLCVHQMFERQVERTPDAVAAEVFTSGEADSGIEQITYRELNARANQLAARLRAQGVGADTLVGIYLPRCLDLAVAVLGVLKAGGAYVPLEPTYPAERLAFMAQDAQLSVIITSNEIGGELPDLENAVTMRIDDAATIDSEPQSNLPCNLTPDNLAYVIYTSGSTGRPKGVMIAHRGLTNYLSWSTEAYAIANGSGAPVSSPLAFDATITSFFPPLLTGGRIVLLPERDSIEALCGVLRKGCNYGLIKVTPAHLEILSQLLKEEECAHGARAFVIGGEALREDMLSFWRNAAPETKLINEYGPTETVVGCCVHEATNPQPGMVPIGRPIANTQLYVLDAKLEPVPQGVIGELYIGGDGVARGYWNRPDLTAERFIDDPFSSEQGARLYRTGDLVRYRFDGNLEFHGRADSQVKIRGFRIELGEIEATLASHPRVAECQVLTDENASGDRHLSAYFIPEKPVPSTAELRGFLAAKLPEHMIPAFFISLDAFPLTPNGKVDLKALPKPTAEVAVQFLAPRDPLEIKLASLWERVLGVPRVGVRDNFFDLGGHSLLAVRLTSLVEQEFAQAIPLATILRGPTVEQLARILRSEVPAGKLSALVPIQTNGNKPPFFCVPGAGGNAIYLYNLARHLGADQPFYGLQGVGIEGEAAPHTRVEQMASHYIDALKSVQPQGPYYVGGHSLGGWVAFEMAQQLQRAGHDVALVAIIDTAVPVPGNTRDTTGWDEAKWISELAERIGQLLNPDLKVRDEDLRPLGPEEQLERFRQALVNADLFPAESGTAHLRNVLELYKAHSQVRYEMSSDVVPVPMALFRTANDPSQLASLAGQPAWGWAAFGPTDVDMVPGEHLSVLRPPHVEVLAERIAARLAASRRIVSGKATATAEPKRPPQGKDPSNPESGVSQRTV